MKHNDFEPVLIIRPISSSTQSITATHFRAKMPLAESPISLSRIQGFGLCGSSNGDRIILPFEPFPNGRVMSQDMFNADRILFAAVDLAPPDKKQMLTELAEIPAEKWHWDYYRGTHLLPLMTINGMSDARSLLALKNPKEPVPSFCWTELAPKSIVDYFEKHVFSWIQPKARVMILRTGANKMNNEHIDCTPEQFGSRQHKFRLVLNGRVDSLYFLTSQGKVFAPEVDKPFIIDGSWPHGMYNNSSQEKVTICIGAPWTGADTYPELSHVIEKEPYNLPSNYEQYFKK